MKIFVSSTFTDMDLARDIINKQVQPLLAKRIRETYGQDIDFTDFRWGIDTENTKDSTTKTVLSCLDAIDEAAPPMPMVILLGDRCSRPLPKKTIQLVEEKYGFIVQNKECGITELEIEYGALRNEACRRRAVVCFITHSSSSRNPDMQKLRRKLRVQLEDENILHFVQTKDAIVSGDEYIPFAEVLAEKLWKLITDNWTEPEEDSQEDMVHRSYMDKKAAFFRGRGQLFGDCMDAVASEAPVVFIKGDTGAGKSSLLSRLLTAYRDGENKRAVLPIYCGLTENVDSGMEVLQRFVRYLENALGKPRETPENFDAWKDYEEQLCLAYEESDLPPLLVGIDAVDQLRVGNVSQELLFLPFGRYKKLQFIVSFPPNIAVPRRFSRAPVIKLKPMDEQETREIIRGILSEYNKRELSQEIEDRLVKFSHGKMPLELNMAVQALRMMDITEFDEAHKVSSMAGINKAQHNILDELIGQNDISVGRDLLSYTKRFLKFACARIDERLYTSLRHIAAAPYGMTIDMLKQLDPDNFDEQKFLLLRYYLQEVFILRADGRYDFAHKCLRQALFFVNLKGHPDDPELSRKLFKVLYELEDTHPVRTSDILYFAHQCRLHNYITDYIINAYWSNNLQHRRQPIRQLLKNGDLCREIIENLPRYLTVPNQKDDTAEAKLREMTRRLYRFARVFGQLFAQEDCDAREAVWERSLLYGEFVKAVNDAFANIKDAYDKKGDTMVFEPFPYFAFISEWFIVCMRYARYREEVTQFNERERVSFATEKQWCDDLVSVFIGYTFMTPTEQALNDYAELNKDTLGEQFFSSPERTFRAIASIWLNADCRYDLTPLFAEPMRVEKYFIRVYAAVAELLSRQQTPAIAKETVLRRYEVVCARAKELDCPMMSWFEFISQTRSMSEARYAATISFTPMECSRLYRDLEYKESTRKYTAYFGYVRGTLSKLFEGDKTSASAAIPGSRRSAIELPIERKVEAIACCRDAVDAAERALHFTDGRVGFFVEHSYFSRTLRDLLLSLDNAACLPQLQEVYERHFALILDSGISVPTSQYRELLQFAYPQSMARVYEKAGQTPAAEDVKLWNQRVYTTVVCLLNEAESDPELRNVRLQAGDGVANPQSWDDEEYDWDGPLVENDCHTQMLNLVLQAVEAMVAVNRADVSDFDALESTGEQYDALEVAVLSNFPDGSQAYPNSELKRRVTALRQENAYPNFTDLLCRLDEALTPPSRFGVSKSIPTTWD